MLIMTHSPIDVVAKEILSSEVGPEMETEMRLLAMAMKAAGRITMAEDEGVETTKTAVKHNAKAEVNEAVIAAVGTRHKMKAEEETLELDQVGDVVLADEEDIEMTTAEMRLIRTMHTRLRTP